MAERLIAFPFEMDESGGIRTQEDGTDEYAQSELMMILAVNTGERELVPGFGIPDPRFSEVDTHAIATCTQVFAPHITIGKIDDTFVSGYEQRVEIEYSVNTEDIQ